MMGQSSSQIDPGTQPPPPGSMPPPPLPEGRKRKTMSPPDSIAGESTRASKQLVHDLDQSILSLPTSEKRSRKVRKSTESDLSGPSKSKRRKTQQEKLKLDHHNAILQESSQPRKRQGRTAQRNGKPRYKIGDDEPSNGFTKSDPDNRIKSWLISQEPEKAQQIESMGSKKIQTENSIDQRSDALTEKKEEKNSKANDKVDHTVERVLKPVWLDSVPTTSSGPFTSEERAIVDRIFHDVAVQHNLHEYVLKKMIQDWREAGIFTSQLYAALPNRSKDATRKFCKRRYHTMQRGPWTEEQDNDLRSAYLQWPDKWTKISDDIDRTAGDCKDRWTKHLKFTQKNSGPWSTTETFHLHELVARCMGALTEAHDEGDMSEGALDNPQAYLDFLNWNLIEQQLHGIRSAHQCRQRFLKSWSGIVAAFERKGLRSPYQKKELSETIFENVAREPSQLIQSNPARDRVEYARRALQNFEIGDYYDVFVEVHTSFSNHEAQFADTTFWSIVGQKNISRFSIVWNGTTIRRIALQTALEDWPREEKRIERKLAKAETLQAKALVLARWVDKTTPNLNALLRTYKPELIGKTRDEIMEMKRTARKQQKPRATSTEQQNARNSQSSTAMKPEKTYLSKDYVSDSEDEQDPPSEDKNERDTINDRHTEQAYDLISPKRERSGQQQQSMSALQKNSKSLDSRFEIQDSETELETSSKRRVILPGQDEDISGARGKNDRAHKLSPAHPLSDSDSSSSSQEEPDKSSGKGSESMSEVDNFNVPARSLALPSVMSDSAVARDAKSNTNRSEVNVQANTDGHPANSIPFGSTTAEVEVERSSSVSSQSNISSNVDKHPINGQARVTSRSKDPNFSIWDRPDSSDYSSSSDETSRGDGNGAQTTASPLNSHTKTEGVDTHANDAATNEIISSSVNSRDERSLAGTPDLSPADFVKRCQTAGQDHHTGFNAINKPSKLKRVYRNWHKQNHRGFQ